MKRNLYLSVLKAVLLSTPVITLSCEVQEKGSKMEGEATTPLPAFCREAKCPHSIGETRYYEIPKFQGAETNRNHFDERNGEPIKYLVMHYTVANRDRSLEIFTADKNDDRVSSHYLIMEEEENGAVSGGEVIRVVPEGKNACMRVLVGGRIVTSRQVAKKESIVVP